jgi:hypothetical protein
MHKAFAEEGIHKAFILDQKHLVTISKYESTNKIEVKHAQVPDNKMEYVLNVLQDASKVFEEGRSQEADTDIFVFHAIKSVPMVYQMKNSLNLPREQGIPLRLATQLGYGWSSKVFSLPDDYGALKVFHYDLAQNKSHIDVYRREHGCDRAPSSESDSLPPTDAACCQRSCTETILAPDLVLIQPRGLDLKEYMKRSLTTQEISTLAKEIIDCYRCLEKANLMHGDLKPENLIVTGTGTSALHVHMIDFESVVKVKEKTDTFEIVDKSETPVDIQTRVGTIGYCSTRSRGTNPYEEDAYAILVILVSLLSRLSFYELFKDSRNVSHIRHILSGQWTPQWVQWLDHCQSILDGYPSNPQTFTTEIRDALAECYKILPPVMAHHTPS